MFEMAMFLKPPFEAVPILIPLTKDEQTLLLITTSSQSR
jgi:hypothetical protein